MLASSEAVPQVMMDAILHYSAGWGLFIYVTKTKVMMFAKALKSVNIVVDGSRIPGWGRYVRLISRSNGEPVL